jgi:hypothetical protein
MGERAIDEELRDEWKWQQSHRQKLGISGMETVRDRGKENSGENGSVIGK